MISDRLTTEQYFNAISPAELLKAAAECRKGVFWKESVQKWWLNRYSNVNVLHEQLISGKYKLQKYRIIHINDPKPRDVCAIHFRDRVVQRSLCNNGLYDALTRPFICCNVACQKEKGMMLALEQMVKHLRSFWRSDKSNKGYFIKLDIHHFFMSTSHMLLKDTISYYIREPHFKDYIFKVIDSFNDPKQTTFDENDPLGIRGIGLGSQLSQLMQLLFLNVVDHYIKEQLKVKHYIRYMDDMILLFKDRNEAHSAFDLIEKKLKSLGLQLNPKSTIGSTTGFIQFLKVNFSLSETGKVKTKSSKKTFLKEIRRLTTFKRLYQDGVLTDNDVIQHLNTWAGFAMWRSNANQIKLMKSKIIDCGFEQHLKKSYLNDLFDSRLMVQ